MVYKIPSFDFEMLFRVLYCPAFRLAPDFMEICFIANFEGIVLKGLGIFEMFDSCKAIHVHLNKMERTCLKNDRLLECLKYTGNISFESA